jgi:hypothetical protein
MGFVKYTNTGGRIGKPTISIWTRGQIGFSNAAIIEYDLKSYKYAVVYYNDEEKKIGITLTNNDKEDGINKLIHRKGGGISFSAMSFLKTYKVDFSKTKQYDFEYDKENKMFIISLDRDEEQQE